MLVQWEKGIGGIAINIKGNVGDGSSSVIGEIGDDRIIRTDRITTNVPSSTRSQVHREDDPKANNTSQYCNA